MNMPAPRLTAAVVPVVPPACLFVVLILAPTPAAAQPPGFSPDSIFDRIDADGDGELSPDEINAGGRTAGFLERMGLDTDRPVSRRDFSRGFEDFRRRMQEQGGFGGRGGDRGGERGDRGGDRGRGFRDRGRDDRGEEDERDRGRDDRDRGDDREEDGRDWRSRYRSRDSRDDRGDDRRDDARRGSSSKPKQERPRVTIDLPEEYDDRDFDGDGQIGLYEWRQWDRTALADFLRFDLNGDGYLTPLELLLAGDAPPAAGVGGSPVRVSARSSATVEPTDRERDEAARYFGALDKNGDGRVNPDEWSVSRRLKPMFENAGADLDRDMDAQQFEAAYVKAVRSGS